jgi:hypothetical protein
MEAVQPVPPCRPSSYRRAAALVGTFFVCLYLLTMGGHTDSPDEESMFQVAQSLAERGSADVPPREGSTGSVPVPGRDGRWYAATGATPSVLAVPFYVLGDAMAARFPASHHEYITRFAVCTLDPIISAAACVLVFLFAIRLGYSLKISLCLAMAYGLASIAWPYSKYFWGEPITAFWLLLATYGAFVAVRENRPWWAFTAGVALGIAVGAKITTIIVAPAYFFYLLQHSRRAADTRGTTRDAVRRAIVFTAAMILPGLLIAFFNYIRFGNPIQSGYQAMGGGATWFTPSNWWGVAGLLVSPGKSVFLYSPVALLSLAAVPLFWSRRPWETALFACVFCSHLVLYGLFMHWHGDAAWGPRYMVPVTPLLILPAGALLAWTAGRVRRAAWISLAVLFLIGVGVQLLGVLVNPCTYIVQTGGTDGPGSDERRWHPAKSPLVAHYNLLFGRMKTRFFGNPPDVFLADGFHESESGEGLLFPRWTSASANLEISSVPQGRLNVTASYYDHRPPRLGTTTLSVLVNGKPVRESSVRRDTTRVPSLLTARIDVPPNSRPPVTITIQSNGWMAREVNPVDARELGIMVEGLRLEAAGRQLSIGRAIDVPPMPVSADRPWSKEAFAWFYNPPNHLADNWMWYWSHSGLTASLVWVVVLLASGLIFSAILICRLLSTQEADPNEPTMSCDPSVREPLYGRN